jgi:Nitrile hydratase, alpha chain
MSGQPTSSRDTITSRMIERATGDPQFRQELLQNPRETLERELGVRLPAGIEIRVVEETSSTLYLVLPPQPMQAGQELSDQELEQVAGGWSGAEGGQSCGCPGPPG